MLRFDCQSLFFVHKVDKLQQVNMSAVWMLELD